jgi:hypothetical protein
MIGEWSEGVKGWRGSGERYGWCVGKKEEQKDEAKKIKTKLNFWYILARIKNKAVNRVVFRSASVSEIS